jgi:hypothetical protein
MSSLSRKRSFADTTNGGVGVTPAVAKSNGANIATGGSGNATGSLHEVDEGDDADEFGMSPAYRGCGGASTGGGGNSPIDGSSGEEQHVSSNGLLNSYNGMSTNVMGSSTTSTGKPLSSSNNFVSKLYQ